jgi:cytochrome P450
MTVATSLKIPVEHAAKLADPKAYASDDLHNTYTWLRANNPLGIAEIDGFDPFWVVTRHQDLMDISKDNKLFPYGNQPSTFMNKDGAAFARQFMEDPMVLSLIQMDPPVHLKHRLLTQSWFMPANIKKREEQIRTIARKAVDRLLAMNGSGDFVAGVSLNYPLEIIMNILGVPEEDFPFMLSITQEIFGPLDPDTQKMLQDMSSDQISEIQRAVVGEVVKYFEKITEARKANPADDLASVLVNAEIDGKPIAANALNGYYLVTATAGHDTTSSSTSTAMWALATQPGLLQRLQADPSLLPAFIDEAIRWASPVKTFMRSVAQDVEVGGRQLKAGDWLMLCYASANRDEAVFEDPFTFNIDRSPNKHLAFGFGPHLCLGQHLAKMEMRILFEELLPKLKSVRLSGEAKLSESYFVNGLKNLPIQFELVD